LSRDIEKYAANVGRAAKTKLTYKAYLSFNQLREYVALLVENRISNEKNTFQMKIIEHSLLRRALQRFSRYNVH
jgi:predicted transcriptional regulator